MAYRAVTLSLESFKGFVSVCRLCIKLEIHGKKYYKVPKKVPFSVNPLKTVEEFPIR